MSNVNEFLWSQKYRPTKIKDAILPEDLKKTFQQFVDGKNVPNMILHGRAGVGKTTVALAMLDEIGADSMMINASLNRNIDTLRTDIANFASTVSFTEGRKYVIMDESDQLTAQFQGALRGFLEEFSSNCGFIFTCNHVNKIIDPLHSRCTVIDFKFENEDKPKLASDFYKRVCDILTSEEVEYDKKVVAKVVQNYFPDWRRTLNELQRYASSGRIDSGILKNYSEEAVDELIKLIKERNFNGIRTWAGVNSDIDTAALFRSLYSKMPKHIKSNASIANLIVILAEYEYKAAFVANQEINNAAAFVTIMVEIEDWK